MVAVGVPMGTSAGGGGEGGVRRRAGAADGEAVEDGATAALRTADPAARCAEDFLDAFWSPPPLDSLVAGSGESRYQRESPEPSPLKRKVRQIA